MANETFKKRVLLEEIAKISNTRIKDFNWQVKLAMSSDKLANLKEPLVNVTFELESEEGRKTESVEMNKSELKDFIDSLEAANKTVLQLRS